MINKKKFLIIILSIIWITLPSSFIYNEGNKSLEIRSPDNEYKVVIYREIIISPLSFYNYLADKNYFFVLYNKKGKELFKPSLFYGTSKISAYDSIEFIYNKNKFLFYPEDDGYASFEILKI